MKYYLTIFSLLLFLTAAAAQDKAPKLVLETFEHDFGKIKDGNKVSYTFQLKNEGTADAVIEHVATTCGCTTSDYDHTIAPGQVGKITLTVMPSGTGKNTKYATVSSNDPRLGEFRLTVKFEPFMPKGYRVGSFLFDPTNEITAKVAPGQMYEGNVGIYFSSDRNVTIKSTAVDNPAFTANVVTVTPGREFKLHVKSADKLPVGSHKLQAKLTTDDPNQELLEVMFTVQVGGETVASEPAKPSSTEKQVNQKSPTKTGAKAKR
jgi:hypothetical protein